MRVIDADGHVEENLDTFSDKYLDPAFRALRPRVTAVDGLVYWVIDEQLYPRRVGPGCHNLGTPTNFNGQLAAHTQGKTDSIGSMELSDLTARLTAMDEEDIAIQVIYTTLFLAYPLTKNVGLGSAITTSYNRWMGDRLSGHPRIKWSAVVNLDDVAAAVGQVHEAKKLGAVSVMVLGTAGDDMLDHPRLFPFYQALCEENLALGVHVGWSCPSINNLYSHIYPSGVIAFHVPLLMAFTALISGGVLDRFPDLRHRFSRSRLPMGAVHSRTRASPLQKPGFDVEEVFAPDRADSETAGDGIHQTRQYLFQHRSRRRNFAQCAQARR